MAIQITDLEKRLNQRFYLRNEVTIPAAEEMVIYRGEAIDLHFDGLNIRGTAALSRYRKTEGTRNERKLVRRFPPKFQITPVPVVDQTLIWRIVSDDIASKYFFSHGKLATDYDCDAHYRTALKGAAANQNIGLTHQLFEMVFGPIDAKILAMYQQARKTD